MKLFNFNSKKKPAKARSGAKKTQKKKFILSRKQKVIAIVGGVVVLAGFGYTAYSVYSMNDVGAGGCVSNLYKKGAVKTCVKYAQQMLGMSNPSSSFSAAMYKNVEAFQSKYGLTVDGIIGPNTWRKLCSKGVNATAKKNAGCDGASSSSSNEKTGWTSLGKISTKGYSSMGFTSAESNVKACKEKARGGTYVVKANFTKGSSGGTGDVGLSLLSSSHQKNFADGLRVKRAWEGNYNVTLHSGINVSGSDKFYLAMNVNGDLDYEVRTRDILVSSLLVCP